MIKFYPWYPDYKKEYNIMELSINIGYLTKKLTMAQAAELLSINGFTALDYTPPVSADNWESIMRENLEIFSSFGLKVHQTHAPYNRYGKWGKNHRLYVERTVEATAAMGAELMVAHGDEFDYENIEYSPEAALAYNHDYFLPYVEKAEKAGVGVAFENLFCEPNHSPRFCSEIEDLLPLIESFENKNVSCCWDFGHAAVSFKENQPQKLAQAAKYITCTHVHDNDSRSDEHLPPYFGKTDWGECMSVLKSADYSGTLSYELVHGAIPQDVAPDFVKMLASTGKNLMK